jgi:hypothetical protein
MSERSYPYEAWTVGRTGRVDQVKIVGRVWPNSFPDWDQSEGGRGYDVAGLFTSKESAIAAGLAACDAAQVKLDNSQAKLSAKRKTLEAQL